MASPLRALRAAWPPGDRRPGSAVLGVQGFLGLVLRKPPIGLSAGFDKDAEAPDPPAWPWALAWSRSQRHAPQPAAGPAIPLPACFRLSEDCGVQSPHLAFVPAKALERGPLTIG